MEMPTVMDEEVWGKLTESQKELYSSYERHESFAKEFFEKFRKSFEQQ